MRITVISLPFDKQRRIKIKDDLTSNDLEFTFSDAVYGKDLPADIKENLPLSSFLKRKSQKPTDGEIGCSFSHINVYKKLLESNDEWICVLEDDVIIDKQFSIFIKQMDFSDLKPGALYLLGGQDGLNNRHKVVRAIKGHRYIGQQKFHRIVSGEQFIFRTCCYVLHRITAEKLISEFEDSFFVADEWAYFKTKGIIEDIYLSSFIHHPLDLSNSWIEKERVKKNSNFRKEDKSSFFKKIIIFGKNRYTIKIKKIITLGFWYVRNKVVALRRFRE
ncbi:glycosyltransferase family 25 protein [Klebsiella pneumoniae]|uniref:glycosyltransferase family 25 protein n=1 Tax=Klebsiella pneumoniae TaxID=573 RepID=UPI00177E996A|nr:glycosyltransferase family 25 protein [Klebsiella pneumoniae]MBD8356481.1 glycosyltransferase family 25 protein [Klebsiella pneumoniae]